MIAAIYARVSTEDQHCEMQLADLRGLAARQVPPWDVIEYVEKESSRKKRPVFDRLMADGKQRKYDVVLVWKLDRFGRRLVQLVQDIETLALAGVRFWCPGQNIDTDQRNPVSRLTLQILGAVAEFERDLNNERTHAGLKSYRKAYEAGEIGKTRHSHSGLDLPPGRPRADVNVLKVLQLRKQGLSWRDIGKKLKIDQATIRRAVKRLKPA